MRYKNILFLLAILITLAFSGQAFSATYTYDNYNTFEVIKTDPGAFKKGLEGRPVEVVILKPDASVEV